MSIGRAREKERKERERERERERKRREIFKHDLFFLPSLDAYPLEPLFDAGNLCMINNARAGYAIHVL